MRRLFTVFLLLVLPLQFCWAAAASLCAHEVSVQGGGHFGHHEHRHTSDGGAPGHASHAAADNAPSDAPADGAPSALDNDCGYCHLAQLTPVPPALHRIGDVARSGFGEAPWRRIDSHIASRRDRPDWRA